jgi:hypothetical protein
MTLTEHEQPTEQAELEKHLEEHLFDLAEMFDIIGSYVAVMISSSPIEVDPDLAELVLKEPAAMRCPGCDIEMSQDAFCDKIDHFQSDQRCDEPGCGGWCSEKDLDSAKRLIDATSALSSLSA